jgi:deazaflavin-dependent oxidoreductase (nitroreductase family)
MQQEMTFFPYPGGFVRLVLKLPILLYRMGLGELLKLWPLMVLTTRGRKSGLPRYTALEFRQHGSKVYVISGWGKRPQWYRNLLSNPQATLRIGRRRVSVRASVVDDPAEAVRVLYMFRRTSPVLWEPILARMSTADTIDLKTLSEVFDQFTIVRFDTVPEAPVLPAVSIDYTWVWPLAAVTLTLVLTVRVLRAHR